VNKVRIGSSTVGPFYPNLSTQSRPMPPRQCSCASCGSFQPSVDERSLKRHRPRYARREPRGRMKAFQLPLPQVDLDCAGDYGSKRHRPSLFTSLSGSRPGLALSFALCPPGIFLLINRSKPKSLLAQDRTPPGLPTSATGRKRRSCGLRTQKHACYGPDLVDGGPWNFGVCGRRR
jgi:hypothetical protein